MNKAPSVNENKTGLQPYLSPLAVWALSVGSAIGWGSLVVTSQNYLSQAGPMGSILGLLIGFVMMLLVANHYHFLANRYPGTGGLSDYRAGEDLSFHAVFERADARMYEEKQRLKGMGAITRDDAADMKV